MTNKSHKVLRDNNAFLDLVIDLSKQSKSIYISSFGLWAGVKSNGYNVGEKYDVKTYKVLKELAKKDTKMLIGTPELYECKPECLDCIARTTEQINRISTTLNMFGIEYRTVKKNHGKYYLFDTYDVIIGGMNFTTSNWIDYMFHVKDKELYQELLKNFNKDFNCQKGE